jgi:GNAT superfamily N-acetyltransferase
MADGFEMRRALRGDAEAMADAHVDSIQSLGPAFYSRKLVEAWKAGVSPSMYIQAMAGGEVFFIALAPLDGAPAVLGFASHVPKGGDDGASCYVRGRAARRGVGSALWRLAEAHARAEWAAAITIESSLAGVAFYRAQGFVEIEPCHVQLRSRVSIPCVLMRKTLTGASAG